MPAEGKPLALRACMGVAVTETVHVGEIVAAGVTDGKTISLMSDGGLYLSSVLPSPSWKNTVTKAG